MKKKGHPKFNVLNYGAKSRKRVKARWRKPRGIDNKKREKFQGYGASPSIGYKNSSSVRFARPDGRHEMLIHNEKELMKLVETKGTFVARFAHDVSKRKRLAIQRIADMHQVHVVNRVKA